MKRFFITLGAGVVFISIFSVVTLFSVLILQTQNLSQYKGKTEIHRLNEAYYLTREDLKHLSLTDENLKYIIQ